MSVTNINSEHEQLVLMFNQLMNEREILYRKNDYLKAKLNQSILIETINNMKKERDLLLKLLSHLTINNNKNEPLRHIHHHIKANNIDPLSSTSYSALNGKSFDHNKKNSTVLHYKHSSTINHDRVHRLKPNFEQQQSTVNYRTDNTKENLENNSDVLSSSFNSDIKHFPINKKNYINKTLIRSQTQEFNKLIRKHNIQLKHSQNSPFQHYRSQSLQDLT